MTDKQKPFNLEFVDDEVVVTQGNCRARALKELGATVAVAKIPDVVYPSAPETEAYRRSRFEEMNRKLDEIMAHPASGVDKIAPHTVSQVAKIAAILREQGFITLWETHFKPGNGIDCIRLGARIDDLKRMGIKFVMDRNNRAPMIELPNGKKVARYELEFWDMYGVKASRAEMKARGISSRRKKS